MPLVFLYDKLTSSLGTPQSPSDAVLRHLIPAFAFGNQYIFVPAETVRKAFEYMSACGNPR